MMEARQRETDMEATMEATHEVVVTAWRGRKSARCSCKARWTSVGYATSAERRGEEAMIAHVRSTGGVIVR